MNIGLGIVLCTYYLLVGLGLNLAYHRILAHRSLRLPQNFERFLVTLGLPAGTPIQWVGTHRFHHRHADTELDPHSPVQNGFLYAHVGWYLGTSNPLVCILYCLAGPFRILIDAYLRPRTNQQYVSLAKDISSDAYYSFVSKPRIYAMFMIAHFIIPIVLVVWLAGLTGFFCFWLFLIYAYNAAECVDSLAHLWGKKGDASSNARDVPIFGILSMGEGWHASHHRFPYSARHGLQRWQFDAVWQIIRFLRFLGIATDVRLPGSDDESKTEAQTLRVNL